MTESTVTIDELVGWLRLFAHAVNEQRTYLTELDSAIGDADHGANMDRGMTAALAKLDGARPTSVDELFKGVGMTLVSTVGGASGPLYGTFFLRFGTTAGSVAELDGALLGAALRAGLDGVVARGKAEPGDKTMFDALAPAVEAYDRAIADGSTVRTAVHQARAAAEEGRDATEGMQARKGRASYLGERSVGHLDPGAASSALLVESLDEALADR